MYYTAIKHSSHLRTLEKCRQQIACGSCFLHFPCVLKCPLRNTRRVFSQCNTWLRLLPSGQQHTTHIKFILQTTRQHQIRFPFLTSEEMTRNKGVQAKRHGKSVTLQNIKQDNTMDRAATLPLDLYKTKPVLKSANLNSL